MSSADEPTPVIFNPFEPGYFDDPYDQYGRLRDQDPVHLSLVGSWMLTRHDDVDRMVRDPEMSVAFHHADVTGEKDSGDSGSAVLDYSYPQMVKELDGRDAAAIHALDPPDHLRLRRLLSKVFTQGAVESLRPLAQSLVDDAIGGALADGGVEVMSAIARPLPVRVISEMMGIPHEDGDQLREWSHLMSATLDPVLPPEKIKAAYEAFKQISAYMRTVIDEKRSSPRDDLLSAMIQTEDEGDTLSEDEIVDNVIFLFAAGHETTVNLIGNSLVALVDHPDQQAALRADTSLAENAVDECLRFDSPVQFTRRICVRDLDLRGQVIPAGAIVLACLGAANRDPALWGPTADRLDLGRADIRRHLSFGGGIHFCLGAALARLEGQVLLESIGSKCPPIALGGTPVRNNRIVLRGFDELPVVFR